MSTTLHIRRNEVSRAALSVALIVCSGLWLAAACEYYATSGLKLDWSATPLFWMLAVVITPAICFAGCMILVDQLKRKRQEFTFIECWALVAAFLPVTLGSLLSVWAVKVLLTMSGVR
ncbi:MAG TPA: hypothetical protein VKV04_01710 [Verrucomicrobiae bacterium]|nr:hypothetical protein [Verrucomicrobiae bacterium]